jgi:hypothetical protein
MIYGGFSMASSGLSYITGRGSPSKTGGEDEYDGRPPGGYYNPPTTFDGDNKEQLLNSNYSQPKWGV